MFVIKIPNLSLKHTYFSMQSLRWLPVGNAKGEIYGYLIISYDKSVYVKQNKDMLTFDCTEDEFFNHWFTYFDVKKDYYDYIMKADKDDEFLKMCIQSSKGSRMLNKGIWESLLELIFYANQDESKSEFAKFNSAVIEMDNFCNLFGKSRKRTLNGIKHDWAETPRLISFIEKWEKLNLSKKDCDRKVASDYKYIYDIALFLLIDYDLERLTEDREYREEVIQNVCENMTKLQKQRMRLYVLRDRRCFPVYDELELALWEEYGDEPAKIIKCFKEKYKEFFGVFMQYILVDNIIYKDKREERKWGL